MRRHPCAATLAGGSCVGRGDGNRNAEEPMKQVMKSLSPEDHQALTQAYEALEHPGLAARISNFLGIPVTASIKMLPHSWSRSLTTASEAAVARAFDVALASLGGKSPALGKHTSSHRLLAMATGAAGGFLGLPALLIELPLTTIIMLRAIADVARSEGEDLTELEARLACVHVLAFGGRSGEDRYAELGYYELRAALALHFSVIAPHIAAQGINGHLPSSINLIRSIAARFGLVISEKAAIQMVPVLGAAAGALCNRAFIEHFQHVASGHFTVRRLERKYGGDVIEAAYRAIEVEQESASAGVAASRATS